MRRTHYFIIGLVVLMIGIQFRLVDTFVLNAESAQFLAENLGSKEESAALKLGSVLPGGAAPGTRDVTPPTWVGWALISLGTVLVLHAMAIPKGE